MSKISYLILKTDLHSYKEELTALSKLFEIGGYNLFKIVPSRSKPFCLNFVIVQFTQTLIRNHAVI